MKKTSYISRAFLFPLFFLFWGCDDDPSGSDPLENEAPETHQFVWNGLNYWYYWQEDVANLADSRFPDEQNFHDFLNGFQDEEAVFDALLYDVEDDFSWFIEDYEEHEQGQQGISESFGYSYGLVCFEDPCSDIFGYVRYVLPDSPADASGLARGDLFTGVNGSQLTVNNYQNLLGQVNYTLNMASIEDGVISDNGVDVSMQAEIIQENPVYLTQVIETGGYRIGYLLYNAFRYNYHEELNDAFDGLMAEGVDELVLDLRYNGGGTIITSAMLAGMISGLDDSNLFAELTHNSKRSSAENRPYPILEEVPVYDEEGNFDAWIGMNTLSLNRVFVLTSGSTASASEMLINGLLPYMEVIQIGDRTVGKDDGSITVYDAPSVGYSPRPDQRQAINPNHKRAMQPIVLKVVNSSGQDYPNGFTPDPANSIREIDYLENLPPLGDEDDPLLARALEIITGAPIAKLQTGGQFPGRMFKDSRDLQPFGKEMYLLPGDVNRPGLE